MKIRQCAIIDIDGTVADLSHRLHYVKDGKHQWDKFFDEVGQDSPIHEVIRVVTAIQKTYPHSGIVFVSGRSDVCREQTELWLQQYVGTYDALYMRPKDDHRKDTILKREILDQMRDDGWRPWLAIDDRSDIAAMWREQDIMTMLMSDWVDRQERYWGATLHVLIGPSGAGKSTLAANMVKAREWHKNSIISTDSIREEICGDMADQTKNDQVFDAFHSIIQARLNSGMDTVADATNLRRKDRLKVVGLAAGGDVIYHVVNRPLGEKLSTGGWRLNVDGLIERHDQRFKSQLKDIIAGDSLPNVKVIRYDT